MSTELLINAVEMDSTGKDDPSHRLIFIRATDDFLEDGREFASKFISEVVYEKLNRDKHDQFQTWLRQAGASPASLFEHLSIDIIA